MEELSSERLGGMRRSQRGSFLKVVGGVSVLGVLFFVAVSFLRLPPFEFPQNKIIEIQSGMSLGQISTLLKNEGLIRSRMMFEFCVISSRGDEGVLYGKYLFKDPIDACALATRLVQGVSGIPAARVTIPEGSSVREVAQILGKNVSGFNTTAFLTLAEKKEGFLFPDTYFLKLDVTPQVALDTFVSNFDKKIEPLKDEIATSGRSLADLVIMASIIEKEARTNQDQKIVAGILWKRIAIKMPLQVDAPFYYLLGKESSEVTLGDLRMKSPYNTYQNLGLPVGPIGNPGVAAFRAALEPTATPYLFYLSDKDGVMHYAKDFEEHKKNKAKYLK